MGDLQCRNRFGCKWREINYCTHAEVHTCAYNTCPDGDCRPSTDLLREAVARVNGIDMPKAADRFLTEKYCEDDDDGTHGKT